jgi:uncharacterized protein
MKSQFFVSFINHQRFIPKPYKFNNRFFWTMFDLDELDELDQKTKGFSRNRFNLISFYDHDHVNLGHATTKENIQAFMFEQGVSDKILKIELITNPRILGYTFNPVSFYFIETSTSPFVVIEIGNTFKEQKPFLVRPECLKEGVWTFTTQKKFYISPFTSVENTMTFKIKRSLKSIVINIDDFTKEGKLEVKASYTGQSKEWNMFNLLEMFFTYPLMTLGTISSIHYHALKLFLKKVPYFKKSDEDHLQVDHYIWKNKSFRKKN